MIDNYNSGSDITLINTMYQKPKKQDDGKWSKDVLTITYKDNITNEKKHVDIINPDYELYKYKEEIYIDQDFTFFTEKTNMDVINVPYNNILKELAKITDNTDLYYDNINNGRSSDNKIIHTAKTLMNSDMDINDHYRMRFARLYKNRSILINKAYIDIEVDNIKDDKDFPNLGEFPINAVTLIDDKTKMISIFLLRTSELPNPQIKEFEDELKRNPKAVIDELHDFIVNQVGGWKQATRFKIIDFGIEFMFYDEEIELIADLFSTIHKKSSDFLQAWNMPFDIPYIIERVKVLGYNPEDILADQRYKFKCVRYWIDDFHTEFKKKGSTFEISGGVVFIDQLVNFASRRSGTNFQHYGLDSISELVANVRKVDFSHITTKIPELAYKSYKLFIFYNVIDVVNQKCIETKTGDVEYLFNKCLVNFTRYEKCHRQSIYLTNRVTNEFYKDGLIIGNNHNLFKEKKGKFVGALVTDPTKVSHEPKVKINGRPINVSRNAVDNDFKSLYPSEDLQNNIGINTQIGLIQIDNRTYDKENPYDNKDYIRGGQFIEDLHSDVILEFCERWLHFAGYRDCMKDIEEYFTYISKSHSNIPVLFDKYALRPSIIIDNKFNKDKSCINLLDIENKETRRSIVIRAPRIAYNDYLIN